MEGKLMEVALWFLFLCVSIRWCDRKTDGMHFVVVLRLTLFRSNKMHVQENGRTEETNWNSFPAQKIASLCPLGLLL